MAQHSKSKLWRLCRIYFRRVRITVWLFILALVVGLVYLNQVGLPAIIKNPLLAKLRAQGVDLQFTRLRLSWFRGIVADNVRFGQADNPQTPALTVKEVGVKLDPKALLRLRLEVDSIALRDGTLVFPVTRTNEHPRVLLLENIQTFLRFLPDDEWALENFSARYATARLRLIGNVKHGSAVRHWSFLKSQGPSSTGVWRERLRRFSEVIEETQFSSPPEFRAEVRGDARDLASFSLRLMLSAAGVENPWGRFEDGRFTARLFPASNEVSQLSLSVEAAAAQTRWAAGKDFQLTLDFWGSESQTNLPEARILLTAAEASTRWSAATNLNIRAGFRARSREPLLVQSSLELQSDHTEVKWGAAAGTRLRAQVFHSLTNPAPLTASVWLDAAELSAAGGKARDLSFEGFFANVGPNPEAPSDPSWVWWTAAEPYLAGATCRIQSWESPELQAESISFGGDWRAPHLNLTNVHAGLNQGDFNASASLNITNRALKLLVTSTIDPHPIGPLLGKEADRWLRQFTWTNPPRATGEISLVIPSWTNRHPDFQTDILPTFSLRGEFNVPGGGTYRGLRASSARSHFSYIGRIWHLPDLHVTRPEGEVHATHMDDELGRRFYWKVHSTITPDAARPALSEGANKGLDLFTFSEPPRIQAEIWGHKDRDSEVGFRALLALTNFTFRGKSFTGVQSGMRFTNKVLECSSPRVQRGTNEHVSADALVADFNRDEIYLTNGFSTTEPQEFAEVIGPQIRRAIEPYRWSRPPTIHAHGIIPMHKEEQADIRFHVQGGPFHWYRLNLPEISGDLHWKGMALTLSNVNAAFYGGRAEGSAGIFFNRDKGPDYQFRLVTTNSSLKGLMTDVKAGTNHLEGSLGGTLNVAKGNADQWPRFDGYGDVSLREGLIWDFPLFGIFSPVLNAVSPGLGNNRARHGTSSFTVTNGVFYSDNLDIRSTGMRLQYRGTLDVEGNVNARVEAGLLRDVWVVGPVISTVLWPFSKFFEYKVSGSLDQLKLEPLYLLPKLMVLPFKTLKAITPGADTSGSRPNAPPKSP